MRSSDCFPVTASAFPSAVDWTIDYDWEADVTVTIALQFLDYSTGLQTSEGDAFTRFSECLRRDITNQTVQLKSRKGLAMADGMRFIISQPAIHRTLVAGELGDSYNWILWAISRTHDPEKRMNTAEYNLPPFNDATNAMNNIAFELTVDWVNCAFLVARKFGGLDEICADFLTYSINIAIREMRIADLRKGVEACVSILNWASQKKLVEAEVLTRKLLQLYRQIDLEPRLRILIGIAFTTTAGWLTDQKPIEWAREILRDYRTNLVQHETLQLLAVSIDSEETWYSSKADILNEARQLAQYYRSSHRSRIDALVALDSRATIIHPFIHGICRFGSTADLMDLFWAWYGEPEW